VTSRSPDTDNARLVISSTRMGDMPRYVLTLVCPDRIGTRSPPTSTKGRS